MLYIYNTLTRQKELFKPIIPHKVSLYVCGVTVYDYCHLGHARTYITFDIIQRYLKSCGFAVTYLRNITDIDDKIIKRAQKNAEQYQALTARFINAMHEDFAALDILPPDQEPRATEHIAQMITLIETLLTKKAAYVSLNGDIYYSVASFADYGCLAHQNLEKLRSGTRVAIAEVKQDPLDFVLWKLVSADEPGWDAPWGRGRPGWHTECSAMSLNNLGQQFDLHGGGFDLRFPHHENEIAQSEVVTGRKVVNIWMHSGFLQIDKQKMSKSLDNFFTIREVLAEWPAEVLRYFLLSGHYRQPLNYSSEALTNAKAGLTRFYSALRGLELQQSVTDSSYEKDFYNAMNDDFNVPEALAALFDLTREINRLRSVDITAAATHAGLLKKLAAILGILQQAPETFLKPAISTTAVNQAHIEDLIQQRTQARHNKAWQEADSVRQQLADMNIVLEDKPESTEWRYNT